MKTYYGMDMGEIAGLRERVSGLVIFLAVWAVSLYLIKKWIALRENSIVKK